MGAPLSIIIPTLNAGPELARTLEALMEGLSAGLICELIISDGGSEDETLAIADEAGAHIVHGAASRGGQLKRGAAAARGSWFLFLHADTLLSPGWSSVVEAHLGNETAGYGRLAFREGGWPGRFVAGWANLRSALFGLPYGDQSLLIPRSLYREIGGYADMPLMEDVRIARALRGRLKALPMTANTSAQRYKAQGWTKRGMRNLSALVRYFLGASPERLAKAYRK